MRICRVTHVLFPDVFAGFASSCHELSVRQASNGHRITVITERLDSRPMYETVVPGYVVIRLPSINEPWKTIGLHNPVIPAIYDYVRNLDFDVVHAYSHLFLTTAMAAKACRISGKPLVISVHGVMALRSSVVNLLQRAYIMSMGKRTLMKASRVICLTKADAAEITKLGVDHRKIAVIPNAVDASKFECKGNDGSVLWAGRFVPEKGVHHLIVTAQLVAKRIPNVRFRLVGDGPLKPRIMHMVLEKDLGNNVFFLPAMKREKLGRLMSKCACFVLPSVKEGLPRVMLEAMASAKPVVAYNIPGVNEIISDGYDGILADIRCPDSMAQAIIKLLENEDLCAKMGERARKVILENYEWSGISERIEQVYEEAIDG